MAKGNIYKAVMFCNYDSLLAKRLYHIAKIIDIPVRKPELRFYTRRTRKNNAIVFALARNIKERGDSIATSKLCEVHSLPPCKSTDPKLRSGMSSGKPNNLHKNKHLHRSFNPVFALCPLIYPDDEKYIYEAVFCNMLPIVISDTHILMPDSDEVNDNSFGLYGRNAFYFRIGSNISELVLLKDFFSLPLETYKIMLKNGKTFIRKKIVSLPKVRTKKFYLSEKHECVFDFPVFDKERCLLSEKDMFISIWKFLYRNYPSEKNKAVLIFGIGKFFRRLLNTLSVLHPDYRPKIAGVTDDKISTDSTCLRESSLFEIRQMTEKLCKCQLISVEESLSLNFSGVFIATDFIEDLLEKRCKTLYPNKHLLKVSDIIKEISIDSSIFILDRYLAKKESGFALSPWNPLSYYLNLKKTREISFYASRNRKNNAEIFAFGKEKGEGGDKLAAPKLFRTHPLRFCKNKNRNCVSPKLRAVRSHVTQKPGKTFLYKKKLECVIVCVNYGDFLSVTLPYNRDNFDRIVIVTSREDVETLNVATSCDAEVVTTDVYRDNNSLFNKGKMINIGLNRLDKDGWILITDADVLFRKNLKNRIFSRILNIDSLYYAIRLHTPEYNREKWIHEFLKDESIISSLHFKSPGDNKMPWGYFQLFNIHSKFLVHTHRTHIYPENFPSAGEVDYQFQSMWDDEYKVLLPEVIIHIAHGKLGENWSGRKTPKFYISEA